jgi:hypothetical protein
MIRIITALTLALALSGGTVSLSAQSTTPKEETKKAGDATKEAGKDIGGAAKHAGKATAKETKKGAKAVKKAVTGTAHANCMDGTRQAGTSEAAAAAACAGHGGVKKS